jgi:hypothetical protein
MEFLKYDNWWTKKYQLLLGNDVRYPSMKIALNLLYQSGGNIMVETGTVRQADDFAGGGMSTVVFGDFAKFYGKRLWTVDILPEAIGLSQKLTAEYSSNISYVISDSVGFLSVFPQKIDFLYLDSMDCPENDPINSPNLIKSQKHQLKELWAAWDKLHSKSVVLLDDNHFANGGKCRLAIDFLREKGWTCLINEFQSLWIKL